MKDSGNSHYHVGNYYNFTAAVAMNSSVNYKSADNPANQSICPAGWTLPNIGKTGDKTFYALMEQYGFTSSSLNGDNRVWKAPLYFSLTGVYSGGGNVSVGSQGAFASPVVTSSSIGRIFLFYNGGSMSSGGSGLYRRNAAPVRCILR